jgi:hypothetical protein
MWRAAKRCFAALPRATPAVHTNLSLTSTGPYHHHTASASRIPVIAFSTSAIRPCPADNCTAIPAHSNRPSFSMGGQPYLYNPPTRYSALDPQYEFNPKSVTQASLVPRPPPKPKAEGPLINFNRHPDSYLILPYGNTNAVPMAPNTKDKVKWARYIQLTFRVAQLIGAVGMLVCVICLKGMTDNEGWVLRLPVSQHRVHHHC